MKSRLLILILSAYLSQEVGYASPPSSSSSTAAYGAVFGKGYTKKVCTYELLTKTKGAASPLCVAALIVDSAIMVGSGLGWMTKGVYNMYKDSKNLPTSTSGQVSNVATKNIGIFNRRTRVFNYLKCQTTCTKSLADKAAPLYANFVMTRKIDMNKENVFSRILQDRDSQYQPLKDAVNCIADCQLKPTINFTCNFIAKSTPNIDYTINLGSELARVRSLSNKENLDITSSKLHEYVAKDLSSRCNFNLPNESTEFKSKMDMFKALRDQAHAITTGQINIEMLKKEIETKGESFTFNTPSELEYEDLKMRYE